MIIRIHLKLGKVCIGKKNLQCRNVPHSPNYLNNKHWAIRMAWRNAWKEEVWGRWIEIKKDYSKIELPFKIARITPYVFAIKPQDHDNFIASLKPIIDGLKDCNIITDDDYDHIRYNPEIYVPIKTKEAEHIELMIEKLY